MLSSWRMRMKKNKANNQERERDSRIHTNHSRCFVLFDPLFSSLNSHCLQVNKLSPELKKLPRGRVPCQWGVLRYCNELVNCKRSVNYEHKGPYCKKGANELEDNGQPWSQRDRDFQTHHYIRKKEKKKQQISSFHYQSQCISMSISRQSACCGWFIPWYNKTNNTWVWYSAWGLMILDLVAHQKPHRIQEISAGSSAINTRPSISTISRTPGWSAPQIGHLTNQGTNINVRLLWNHQALPHHFSMPQPNMQI